MHGLRGIVPAIATALAIAAAPLPVAGAVDDWAGRMLDRINEYRTLNDLPPLALDPALMRAAMAHTHDMAENDMFNHTGSDGTDLGTRLDRVEYRFLQAAENLAGGTESPERTVDLWMVNSGHRHNLLNPRFRDIGIGYLDYPDDGGKVRYRHYWTVVLGVKKKPLELDPEPPLAPLSP